MPKPTTFDRNREIFAAFEKGRSVGQLAEDHDLYLRQSSGNPDIRRTVSLEPFFTEAVESSECPVWMAPYTAVITTTYRNRLPTFRAVPAVAASPDQPRYPLRGTPS
jgi:hypothetical protein